MRDVGEQGRESRGAEEKERGRRAVLSRKDVNNNGRHAGKGVLVAHREGTRGGYAPHGLRGAASLRGRSLVDRRVASPTLFATGRPAVARVRRGCLIAVGGVRETSGGITCRLLACVARLPPWHARLTFRVTTKLRTLACPPIISFYVFRS